MVEPTQAARATATARPVTEGPGVSCASIRHNTSTSWKRAATIAAGSRYRLLWCWAVSRSSFCLLRVVEHL
jgi:hypothetical protein